MVLVELGRSSVLCMETSLPRIRKSQIASEFCHEAQHAYSGGIFWFNAESLDSVLESWRAIATEISLKKEQHSIISMKRWLTQRQNWLVVLDNLTDLAVLRNLTSQVIGGKILVTTRDSAIVGSAQLPFGLSIEPFDWQDAIRLFVLSLQSWDNEDVFFIREVLPDLLMEEGVESLDYEVGRVLVEKYDIISMSDLHHVPSVTGSLPIAIVQCASYLRTFNMSFSAYVDRFNNVTAPNVRRRLHEHQMSGMDYDRNVMSIWEVSYLGLRPEAARMLVYLGFLDRSLVRDTLLQKATSEVSFWGDLAVFEVTKRVKDTFSFLIGDDCLEEALGRLVSLAFVRRTYAMHLLAVPPMVHEWCHLRLSDHEATQRLVDVTCLLHGQLPPLLYSPEDTSAPSQADEVFCHLERVAELTRLYMRHFQQAPPSIAIFYVEAYLWYRGDLYLDLAEAMLPFVRADGRDLVERMVCGARLHQIIQSFQASRSMSLDQAKYTRYLDRLTRIPLNDISTIDDRSVMTQTMVTFRLMQTLDLEVRLRPSQLRIIRSRKGLAQPNQEPIQPRRDAPSLTAREISLLNDLGDPSGVLKPWPQVQPSMAEPGLQELLDDNNNEYEEPLQEYATSVGIVHTGTRALAGGRSVLATEVMVSEGTRALLGRLPKTVDTLPAAASQSGVSPIRSVCAAVMAQCQAQDAAFNKEIALATEFLFTAQEGAALGVALKLAELQSYFKTLVRLSSILCREEKLSLDVFLEMLNLVVSVGDWNALMESRYALEAIFSEAGSNRVKSDLLDQFARERSLIKWIPGQCCFEDVETYVTWLQRRLNCLRLWDCPSEEIDCVRRLGPLITSLPALGPSAQREVYMTTIKSLLQNTKTPRKDLSRLAQNFRQLLETKELDVLRWLCEVMLAYTKIPLEELPEKYGYSDLSTWSASLMWAKTLLEVYRTSDAEASLQLVETMLEYTTAAQRGTACDEWALIGMEVYDKTEKIRNIAGDFKAQICEAMVQYFEQHSRISEDRQFLSQWAERYIVEKGISENVAELEDLCTRVSNAMRSYDAASDETKR
jgi:hypothetical protein